MDEDRIARLKRAARIASRTSGLSHQQELDRIARDEGHAHWSALLRSEGTAPHDRSGTSVTAAATMPRTWASDMLESATGARATRLDEILIGWAGRPVCSLTGVRPVPTGIASAVLAVTAGLILCRCGSYPEYNAGDAIMMPLVIVVALLLHRICWLNPDSAMLRIVRRLVVNSAIVTMLVVTSSLAPAAFGALRYMPPNVMLMPVGAVMTWSIPLIPMLIGTYAGRRGRWR